MVYFLVYFGLVFVLPSVRTYRQTGVAPVTFGKADNAHDYIGKCFKLLLALLAVTILAYGAGNALYRYLLPVGYLEHPLVQWPGMVLCIGSLVWTIVAQRHMGNSWRIGLDEAHKTALVQTGPFRISRNPVFLGMQLTLLGFFALLPNAVSLLVLVCGCILMQIQARLEEAFLFRQHGETYAHYKKSVARFI